MINEMPTRQSLDEAAKAAGYRDWEDDLRAPDVLTVADMSIIAHARTLDNIHQRKHIEATTDDFKKAVINLAGGCRLVADDEMQLRMIMPVEQPDGLTLDRLTREGWIERMPNGGTFKISDAGLRAYFKYTDGRNDGLVIERDSNGK